jgi:hypothetical protein
MTLPYRNIAYGVSDFEKIRSRNDYFVDKTRFIPQIENNDYIFFIRPRRFGKSLWISIMETYYDINKKERFEEFFKGLWIGDQPTAEQGKYLVLSFNFSAVRGDLEFVEQSFEEYCLGVFGRFVHDYKNEIDPLIIQQINEVEKFTSKLSRLLVGGSKIKKPICILIDEYDNFANTILSTQGDKAYHSLTHGEGFLRHFFTVLKEGTSHSGSALKRLFITGVSPVTMDDVTSGFNIGSNMSMSPNLEEMVGFTEQEVKDMLKYYQNEGVFKQDINEAIELMGKWYNNYRFCKNAKSAMYNTDMVLYFMRDSIQTGEAPNDLIDQNIRIDYGKLRHLVLLNRKLNGNFNRLKEIIESGTVISPIKTSFPVEELRYSENFLSLLYYFGLLTIKGESRGRYVLGPPNLAIKNLMFEYLRDAYRDVKIFEINYHQMDHTLQDMAWDGRWEPFFKLMSQSINTQTRIRDYIEGEKVIQGFILAYLHFAGFFISHSEKEFSKGYADIFLEPFVVRYPDMAFGYLIELKYIKRGEHTPQKETALVEKAATQLQQYLKDEQLKKYPDHIQFKGLILIYHGWELVHYSEI